MVVRRHGPRQARPALGRWLLAAVYPLSHGVIKVVLVVARSPAAASTTMIVLSVLDVIVIALTWLEYRRLHGVYGRA